MYIHTYIISDAITYTSNNYTITLILWIYVKIQIFAIVLEKQYNMNTQQAENIEITDNERSTSAQGKSQKYFCVRGYAQLFVYCYSLAFYNVSRLLKK